MAAQNIRVHLVHGTWAKGLLGKSKAWTEAGHSVYDRLRSLLPESAALETFLWSGRNSVSAREGAAQSLRAHLDVSLKKFPKDRHVVVAHSHGGTISSLALADPRIDGRISSLICLATPFTYVASASLRRLKTGILGVASVASAFFWTGVLLLFPRFPSSMGPTGFAALILTIGLFAFVTLAIIAKRAHDKSLRSSPPGPRETTVVLLRGSRDEATLVLAVAQVVNWSFYSFSKFHDVTMPTVRNPVTWLAYAGIFAACLSAGVEMVFQLPLAIGTGKPPEALLLGIFVYGPAVAGFIFLMGCLALAVATGFWGLRPWMVSTVDVETAPPNTACQLYVFSRVESSSLRHRLYEDESVLQMVADLVKK